MNPDAKQIGVLQNVAVAVGILALTALLAWLFNRSISRYVQHRGIDDPKPLTKIRMIQRLLRVAIVLTGFGFAFYALEIDALRRFAIGLFASAGLVGIALGFAAQTTAANLISGVMIAFVQPLRLGDRVMVEEDMGIVEDIGLFYTTIQTWDNRRVIIPNQVLSKNVIRNYTVTDPAMPAEIVLDVAYGTDMQWLRSMLLEETAAHPLTLNTPPPTVQVTKLDAHTFTVRLVAWTADYSQSWDVMVALRERVVQRMAEVGSAAKVGAIRG
ncbi:MAG: mechanosensitive ion channel family protein [Actinobacteria bacterium]|nr:mechanosensitive ion channel family protein [Actinomycetota bacterium]